MKMHKSFNTEVFLYSTFSNFIIAFLLWLFSMILINFPILKYPLATVLGSSIIFISQFIVGPISSFFVTKNISRDLEFFYYGSTTTEDRTNLIRKLYKIPFGKMIETFIPFVISGGTYSILLYKIYYIDKYLSIIFFFSCFVYCYIAALLSYHFTYKLCTKKAMDIINEGVDTSTISKTKYFGTSMIVLFIFYIIIPILFCTVFFFIISSLSYTPVVIYPTGFIATTNYMETINVAKDILSNEQQIYRTIIICIVNVFLLVFLTFLYFSNLRNNILKMQTALDNLIKNNANTTKVTELDLSTELSYTMYLIKQTLLRLTKINQTTSNVDSKLLQSSQDLACISEETSINSLEQSSIIKNIIESMNDVDKSTQELVTKVSDVSKVAEMTTQEVNFGFLSVESNLQKMEEITNSNQITLEGINDLTKKLSNVSDIVNIIDNVANLTKIIAFNAEVESNKINSNDNSFLNVSNKIRELADNVMILTGDVKSTITQIRESSNQLLITGKECTQKISEGNKYTKELEQNLIDIKKSSLEVLNTTTEIQQVIENQTNLFKSLINDMKQINESIEDFSNISISLTSYTESLQEQANHLKTLNNMNIGEE